MPSKKSKASPSKRSLWKAEPACSEAELIRRAGDLACELRPGERVLLEGPMGAGKTTFARALLSALSVRQPAEGSPTFAIAHEYDSPRARVVHLDLYRIRSEGEIEDAGIPAYFWDPAAIVICEWLSLWPDFEASVLRDGANWKIRLDFSERGPDVRSFEATR